MEATIYSGYSDTALYSLFRSESWFGTAEHRGLTLDEKHQALQELENRSAAEYKADAVPVNLEIMTGVGKYSPGTQTISISETFVEHGTLVSGTGREFYINGSPEGANMRCMANVYHEGWHAAQHQSENNPAIYGENTGRQRDVMANLHNYIRSSPENYDLYRIQLVEKEANEYGFQKTAAAMKATEPYYGQEKGMAQLEQQVRQQYQVSLQAAQLRYGNDVADMMQKAMNDVEYNGGVIQSNMSAGYYATRSILVNQQLDTLQKSMAQLPQEADRSAYEAKIAELTGQLNAINEARAAAEQAQAAAAGNAAAAAGAAQPNAVPGMGNGVAAPGGLAEEAGGPASGAAQPGGSAGTAVDGSAGGSGGAAASSVSGSADDTGTGEESSGPADGTASASGSPADDAGAAQDSGNQDDDAEDGDGMSL